MAPTKSTVVRDFSGGLNVVDDDLNLSSSFQPILDNVHRGVDNTLSVRWGTELFVDLRQGTVATGTGTAGITVTWTISTREHNVAWTSHGLLDGDHITFTSGWTDMTGLTSTEIINVPLGIRKIDANNFKIVTYTAATVSGSDASAKSWIKDTHYLAGKIIHVAYFDDHVVAFDTVGEVCKINAAQAITRIWDHAKANATPGEGGVAPFGWSTIDYVSTAIFKGQLYACNGKDKPLLIDFSKDPDVQYLGDPAGGGFSNINTPICRYVLAFNRWVLMAGDPLVPSKVHISGTDSGYVWVGDDDPNDAVDMELNNVNSSSLYIRGLNIFRNLVAVAFDDTVSMLELGIFDEAEHTPEVVDSVARHGSIAHKSMAFLGFDLIMADPIGIPSMSKSQFDNSIIPARMSEFIAPLIQKNISRLTAATLERDVFSVYSTHDNRYILFVPNHDDIETPLPYDPIYYLSEFEGTNRVLLHTPNHGMEEGDEFSLVDADETLTDIPSTCTVETIVNENIVSFRGLNNITAARNYGGADMKIIRKRTETTAYALTYNKGLKIKAWSRYRGWNFNAGCTSLYGRVFLADDRYIWRMGNRFDSIYADYKGIYDAEWNYSTVYTVGQKIKDVLTREIYTCLVQHITPEGGTFDDYRHEHVDHWERYDGVPINFAIELPWADFDKRDMTKILKTMNIDAKGMDRFTVQLYLDYYYKHKTTGERTPQLSMEMVAGDEGGFGVHKQTYGTGRLAIRQRPWPFEARGKLFKFRIFGASIEPLRFIAFIFGYKIVGKDR